MSDLIKSPFKISADRAAIGDLLLRLGLNVDKQSYRGFWNRSRDELELILYDAREIYKKRLVEVAPRTLEDSDETAKELNALWSMIEARFSNHLNPETVSARLEREREVAANRDKKRTVVRSAERKTYTRVCKLESCRREFTTKYARKVFCTHSHKRTHENLVYGGETTRLRRLKKFNELKVLLFGDGAAAPVDSPGSAK